MATPNDYKDVTLGGLLDMYEHECQLRDAIAHENYTQGIEITRLAERNCELSAGFKKERDVLLANHAEQVAIIHRQEAQIVEHEKKIQALLASRLSLYEDLGRLQAVVRAARLVDKYAFGKSTILGNSNALSLLRRRLHDYDRLYPDPLLE